ncbi:gluconate 2-dehydrogenase subunit 3 family protein [Thalassotalea sp. SU-HH00458]|uniref:gluconate 2-dehydrogenase subunit 3 family protein n=1 Tax=Thalassotalea sp. SU-HH00458 TaxID=3127657 RepID=UPI003103A93A
MPSFFNENYRTPLWLKKKLSRRHLLKSAAGASAIAALPAIAFNATSENNAYQLALKDTVWQTLDAVFEHLFPASKTGPSAQDIQATFYLYQLVHEQPTSQDEIDFIYRGVGWLNGFTQNKFSNNFIALNTDEKEQTFRAISQSEAGQNWLNMMILNLYEAMLSPPAYGGNPDGIGWKWLNHQAGFPLPPAGKRYYELPTGNLAVNKQAQRMESKSLIAKFTTQSNKGNNKA